MDNEVNGRPVRLLLLNDRGLFWSSLARLLACEPGLELARECGSAAEALKALEGSGIDLVLLDFDLGPGGASDFILAATAAGFPGRYLLVAGAADSAGLADALRCGASGVFLKSGAPERLVRAIRMVAAGETWLDRSIVERLAGECAARLPRLGDRRSAPSLEVREQTALQGILGGFTNRQIAARMGLSESAVKNILQGLFAKSGVRSRSQLVRLALQGYLGDVGPAAIRPPDDREAENPAAGSQTLCEAAEASAGVFPASGQARG